MGDRTEQLHRALQKFIHHVDELSNEDDPGGNGFHREYRELRDLAVENKDTYPATHGKQPYNIRKNRYKDIVPFDDTRVVLPEKPGVPGSDYINANYVLDAHKREGYIASQGPLPNTLEDFWRMNHEERVKVVMMACREVESGKKKCARYWVEEGAENGIFGEYQVACVGRDSIADDCDERHLQLILPNNEIQDVYQYHYTGWPDHGIPDDIDVILAMIKRMRDIRLKDPDHAPVVVHCSAGCGRTGTICAIDYAWEILKSGQLTEDFNLYEIIKSMREQRQSMVQTPEQYEMAHLAVKELFQKHIEIMNESEYVNVEFNRQNDDNEDSTTDDKAKEQEHVYGNPDAKKLQFDALDTLGKYMEPPEEKAPAIPTKETVLKKEQPDLVKVIEDESGNLKVEQEKVQRLGYENVSKENYENTTIVVQSNEKEEKMTFEQKRDSFDKKVMSSSQKEKVPTFASSFPAPQSSHLSSSNVFSQSLPPTVPRTTLLTQTQPSGPVFVQSVPPARQTVQTPPTTPSGPLFVQSPFLKPSEQTQKQSSNVGVKPQSPDTAKFKSVINIGGSNATIIQGNKTNSQSVGRNSIKRPPSNSSKNDEYELAFPVNEPARNSLNDVKLNSNSSTAIYAAPNKSNGNNKTNSSAAVYAAPNKSNGNNNSNSSTAVYAEPSKNKEMRNSGNSKKGTTEEAAYESVAISQPVKPKSNGRAYEDVVLPGSTYSSVGETSNQEPVPPLPKREYQEPEQPAEQHKSTSMTDKLKNKITNTLFSSKSSTSSDTASNTVPGYDQRIEKKVKGPRSMPWSKRTSKNS